MPHAQPAIDLARALSRLKTIQACMRDAIVQDMHRSSAAHRSAVAYDGSGDTIYAIDRSIEHVLLHECRAWAQEQPFVLIAEGLSQGGEVVLPDGATPDDAHFRLIVDPLDGTRGLMYDKRSAWILAGLAPNRGPATTLADIVLAVQTEAPTTKQFLADVLWAVRGQGAQGERHNLLDGAVQLLAVSPSRADSLAHGFASLSKFFPGRKQIVAEIEEALIREIDGPRTEGKVRVFDDQYICTGGQLAELMLGHDRFNGDIRPALMRANHLPGDAPGMAAHPYDICTELIAREAGVIVTDMTGGPLAHTLTVHDDVAWLGYANPALRARLEPVLQRLFRQYGLIA
jgi:fructose-1,6-bisphosphatase/inositol monophosphatase family enzyme